MPRTAASASVGTKRKVGRASSTEEKNNKRKKTDLNPVLSAFRPLSLEDIRNHIDALVARLPDVPPDQFGALEGDVGDKEKEKEKDNGAERQGSLSNASASAEAAAAALAAGSLQDDDANLIRPPWTAGAENLDTASIKAWALEMQAILEEFNLLVSCVSTATYKWGTDRSGAADQNLSLLSGEMQNSQDQISSVVTPRLTNVLAPVVDLVVDRVEETTTTTTSNEGAGREGSNSKSDGNIATSTTTTTTTRKQNHFSRKLVDPAFFRLCHMILARNSPMLRHVVLSNFKKILDCIKDYLEAQRSDSQTDRGFAY